MNTKPKPASRAFLEGQIAALEHRNEQHLADIAAYRAALGMGPQFGQPEIGGPLVEANAKLREELDRTIARLNDLNKKLHDGKIWNTENPRWTPRAQQAGDLALKEAQRLGATYVGTEHLLLGMLLQEEGIAHRHFIAADMTHAKVDYALKVGRVS